MRTTISKQILGISLTLIMVFTAIAHADEEDKSMENSPECKSAKILLRYCELPPYIQCTKDTVKREQKIGKTVGYINVGIIRNATAERLKYEREARGLASEYKTLTQKSLNPKICNPEQWADCRVDSETSSKLENSKQKACYGGNQ